MNKDFTKQTSKYSLLGSQSYSTRKMHRFRLAKICLVIATFIISFSAFVYYSEIKWQWLSQHFPSVSELSTWIKTPYHAFQNKASHKKENKVKSSTHKVVADNQIHFEFYNTLPNMQMTPALSENENEKINLSKKIIKANLSDQNDDLLLSIKKSKDNIQTVKLNQAQQKKPAKTKTLTTQVFSDPETLAQELSQHIKKLYIVQLGIFKTKESAARFSKTLSRKGFETKIIPSILSGKKVFRVQLGPYDKSQAVMMQKRLQKRSLAGLIRYAPIN